MAFKKIYLIASLPKTLSVNNQGLQEAVFKQNRPSKESMAPCLAAPCIISGSSAQEITQEKTPDSLENSKESNGFWPMNSWPLKNLRVQGLFPNEILKNQEVGLLKIFPIEALQ